MSSTRQVTVRPLSFEDIQRLVAGETIQAYDGYVDGMKPCTMGEATTRPVPPAEPVAEGRATEGNPTHRAVKDGEPVGLEVMAHWEDVFGHSGFVRLYSTPEAEESVNLRAYPSDRPASKGRHGMYVDDPKGTSAETVPIYGSQVSLTLFAADVDPEEALARVQAALEAAFTPEEKMRVRRPRSRPVHDRRVDVYSLRDGFDNPALIATDVLSAESHYVKGATLGAMETRPVHRDREGVEVGL